jgi:hypothetical protein
VGKSVGMLKSSRLLPAAIAALLIAGGLAIAFHHSGRQGPRAQPKTADLATLLIADALPGFVNVPDGGPITGPADAHRFAVILNQHDVAAQDREERSLRERGLVAAYIREWTMPGSGRDGIEVNAREFATVAGATATYDDLNRQVQSKSAVPFDPVAVARANAIDVRDVPPGYGFYSWHDPEKSLDDQVVIFIRSRVVFAVTVFSSTAPPSPAEVLRVASGQYAQARTRLPEGSG